MALTSVDVIIGDNLLVDRAVELIRKQPNVVEVERKGDYVQVWRANNTGCRIRVIGRRPVVGDLQGRNVLTDASMSVLDASIANDVYAIDTVGKLHRFSVYVQDDE